MTLPNNPEVTLDNNTGETRIRATGTNEKLDDGVYVKTYGVFAKDDTGNEILYGLTVSPNPNYFPAYDGVTPQVVTYSYKVNISNTTKITFTNSNDVYVSDIDLDEALQPYAKTVDVNQQLDKKVNVADMRKPASDVAGIEEVNAKQDKISYAPADDSKVVHKTGAEEIADQKTFDIAPIDKTTGNPYITKDGVPKVDLSNYATNSQLATKADDSKVAHLSGANNFDTVPTVDHNPLLLASNLPTDLARTGQSQTFTAAQTFSIAPTITDASQDKGDNQAATMADLKSVENSAWHYIDVTNDMGGNGYISLLYQKDVAKKCIYVIFTAHLNPGDYSSGYSIKLDMSSVVKSFDNDSSVSSLMNYSSGPMGQTTSQQVSGSGSIINFGTFTGILKGDQNFNIISDLGSSASSLNLACALGVSEFA